MIVFNFTVVCDRCRKTVGSSSAVTTSNMGAVDIDVNQFGWKTFKNSNTGFLDTFCEDCVQALMEDDAVDIDMREGGKIGPFAIN